MEERRVREAGKKEARLSVSIQTRPQTERRIIDWVESSQEGHREGGGSVELARGQVASQW